MVPYRDIATVNATIHLPFFCFRINPFSIRIRVRIKVRIIFGTTCSALTLVFLALLALLFPLRRTSTSSAIDFLGADDLLDAVERKTCTFRQTCPTRTATIHAALVPPICERFDTDPAGASVHCGVVRWSLSPKNVQRFLLAGASSDSFD